MTQQDLLNIVGMYRQPSFTDRLKADASNQVGAAAGLPLLPMIHRRFQKDLRSKDFLQDIAHRSGLDVGLETTFGKILPNYGYLAPGLPGAIAPGRHGTILRVDGILGEKGIGKNVFGSGAAVSHELGHAIAHHSTNPFERAVARAVVPTKALGTLGAGISSAEGIWFRSDPEKRRRALDRASILGGVGIAPTLVNEYHASRNGIRLLKDLARKGGGAGIAGSLSNAKRTLPLAYLSYLLGATGLIGGPQLAKHVITKQQH